MYKLQRTTAVEPSEAIFIKEATCTQLAMIWKFNGVGNFLVVSFLIEHDEDCDWDKDKLLKLSITAHSVYDIPC
jgi:hypothetical protein